MLIRLLTSIRNLLPLPKNRYIAEGVLPVLVPFIALIIFGTFSYAFLEEWTILEALYVTIITVTTVGYGDITPATSSGRLFSIFFTLIAIGLASYAISSLAASVIDKQSRRVQQRARRRRMDKIASLQNHVIICGATLVGHRTATELMRRSTPFVIIEEDEERLRNALLFMNPEYMSRLQRRFAVAEQVNFEEFEDRPIADLADEINVSYVIGSPVDEGMLLQAGLERAKGLMPTLDDDRDNIAIILSARDMVMESKLNNPNLRIVSRVSEIQNLRRIYLAGADKLTMPNLAGGMQMVDHMLSPSVGEMWNKMLFDASHNVRFTEWHLAEHPDWIGRSVGELQVEKQIMTLAIFRQNQHMYTPAQNEILQAEDTLITFSPAA